MISDSVIVLLAIDRSLVPLSVLHGTLDNNITVSIFSVVRVLYGVTYKTIYWRNNNSFCGESFAPVVLPKTSTCKYNLFGVIVVTVWNQRTETCVGQLVGKVGRDTAAAVGLVWFFPSQNVVWLSIYIFADGVGRSRCDWFLSDSPCNRVIIGNIKKNRMKISTCAE